MIFEWDDFGCDHIISDKCQSHDCRDQLLRLKELRPDFKTTLFAIPGEMTLELIRWAQLNSDWIELAVHGLFHGDNYECEKWSYGEMDAAMAIVKQFGVFVNGFRAPGWQISDEVLRWLQEHDWWVADQGYNDDRRMAEMNAYINYDGNFKVSPKEGEAREVKAYHGHTWNVGWNGIYEDIDRVEALVKEADSFQFVSELFHA